MVATTPHPKARKRTSSTTEPEPSRARPGRPDGSDESDFVALSMPMQLQPLREAEFAGLRAIVQREAGICLSDGKKALLSGRLARRLRACGLRSYGAYLALVKEDAAERQHMLEAMATGETSFFREPDHFLHLESEIAPGLRRARRAGLRDGRVRVLSAACSTGEEPYSIAMALRAALPPAEGWSAEIDALDLSSRSLEIARRATYPIERAREIPQDYLKSFMLRGTGELAATMRVARPVRGMIRFRQQNLLTLPKPSTPYDMIFCRNVLMYFSPDDRRKTVERLIEQLAQTGVLFVGHAETLSSLRCPMRCVRPTIYARIEERS